MNNTLLNILHKNTHALDTMNSIALRARYIRASGQFSLKNRLHLTAWVALLATSSALAQQAPDAGRLLEQTRPAQPAPAPARPLLPAPAAAPALPADNTPVAVSRFVFEGNQVFAPEQLAYLLKDQTGSAVPFGQLRAALSRINNLYASQGYFLARAVIPRQDVAGSGGALRIQILEGRLGRVSGNLNPAQTALAQSTLAAQGVREGIALKQAPLERSLLLIGERLGGEAPASLSPGSGTGSTDIALQAPAATRPWNAQISLDNAGNRYSGQIRALADLSARDLASLGDALALRTQLAAGLRFTALSYSLPLGHDGLRIEPSFSRLSYDLCCQFAPLEAKGKASTMALALRYPIILRADHSLGLEAGWQRRHSVDETIGGITSDKITTPLSLGMSFTHSGAASGRLLQNGRLQFISGKLDQRVFPNVNNPKSYRKLRADYAATWLAAADQQWLFKASAQAALTNLDSSEKFSLGGANGVRGWPAGEASGDSGAILSAEWRKQILNTGWQFSAFADAGQITQHKNLWPTALPAGQPNSYNLSSIGAGLAYRSSAGWSISAQLAKGLGNNPGKSAAGLNSDGRSRNTQLWVNASWGF
jgi:hemolysin activation/secretion protein